MTAKCRKCTYWTLPSTAGIAWSCSLLSTWILEHIHELERVEAWAFLANLLRLLYCNLTSLKYQKYSTQKTFSLKTIKVVKPLVQRLLRKRFTQTETQRYATTKFTDQLLNFYNMRILWVIKLNFSAKSLWTVILLALQSYIYDWASFYQDRGRFSKTNLFPSRRRANAAAIASLAGEIQHHHIYKQGGPDRLDKGETTARGLALPGPCSLQSK